MVVVHGMCLGTPNAMQFGQQQKKFAPPMRVYERDVIDCRLAGSEDRSHLKKVSEDEVADVVTVAVNSIPNLIEKLRKERLYPCWIRASGLDEKEIAFERLLELSKALDIGLDEQSWDYFVRELHQLAENLGVRPMKVGRKETQSMKEKGCGLDAFDVKKMVIEALKEAGPGNVVPPQRPRVPETPDVPLGPAPEQPVPVWPWLAPVTSTAPSIEAMPAVRLPAERTQPPEGRSPPVAPTEVHLPAQDPEGNNRRRTSGGSNERSNEGNAGGSASRAATPGPGVTSPR